MKNRKRLVTGATVAIVLVLATASTAQISWFRAHADGSNDGFLDVSTAPAGQGSLSIPQIGTFAPGTGPVIGTDGTVYIGNEQGKVFAFHANGTPAWSRQLPHGHAVKASPVVSSDGSIFVVSGTVVRDHRGGESRVRYQSFLNRFTPGGGWTWTEFPERYSTFELYRGSGATSAAPNIWRFGAAEVLMVPVVYRVPGGTEIRLQALWLTGAPLADILVKHFSDEITGSSDLNFPFWPVEFHPGVDAPSVVPFPGVAISFQGGTPFVMVSDRNHDLVGFTFEINGSAGQFTERFRTHDDGVVFASPPVVLSDGHTVIGTTDGRLEFAGPNTSAVQAASGLDPIYSAPTRTADGRLVTVGWMRGGGSVAVLRGNAVQSRSGLPGESIASAAASRTHVFVATANAFLTYDATTMVQIQKFDWVGGGLWPPVIGPQGHVYAMATNILFVFPPPRQPQGTVLRRRP
jgi:hypothetical protein